MISTPPTPQHLCTLGLDLGTYSIGWALIAHAANSQPINIIDCGVRIFLHIAK